MKTRAASEVKERWREIVQEATKHGEVMVTHHERPDVIVLSLDRYQELKHDADASDSLKTLRAEFDRELAPLRQPDASTKLRKAFQGSPKQLAPAANAAASRRRRG
jgi:PHD/YefM family antitoxin component YafN of YafNO toxin-antitoxin module